MRTNFGGALAAMSSSNLEQLKKQLEYKSTGFSNGLQLDDGNRESTRYTAMPFDENVG